MNYIKTYMLLTAHGAVLMMAKNDLTKDPKVLKAMSAGLDKFEVHEVPAEEVKKRYSAHFDHALADPKQMDTIIVIDDDGPQIFKNISFKTLSPPMYYESGSLIS